MRRRVAIASRGRTSTRLSVGDIVFRTLFPLPETFKSSLCNRTLACEELEHISKLIQRMPFLEKTLNTQKGSNESWKRFEPPAAAESTSLQSFWKSHFPW
ncbi:hypothetical protein CEXT_287981 [Caerostris extrusa]|uniref:Uncharacterized protein n=1 Tax=Caerostris extrusa TaxID=172846 RepID=A0AAV4QGS7_CAEEX|nr:hypothetical protein CEXT_287981 [Caerostris extrusa]